MGNYEYSANIVISKSAVYDCSFELGMIYVPPVIRFNGDDLDNNLYSYHENMAEDAKETYE